MIIEIQRLVPASHCRTINNETIRHNLNLYILHMTHFSFLMELFIFIAVSVIQKTNEIKVRENRHQDIYLVGSCPAQSGMCKQKKQSTDEQTVQN